MISNPTSSSAADIKNAFTDIVREAIAQPFVDQLVSTVNLLTAAIKDGTGVGVTPYNHI